ncbi:MULTISPECIES: peptidoglycan D,D-transpeptidase FtsI family protein [Clostridium]|uniref:Penicillin-binding protein 2 n=1 Tax=Clostridium acetobutylicum (strain ATCC 824 / DSM 792 / JCM 1419 / IAM 19013 / LMG 5710 / NBRC 13948 / NRRL B-527 / VKM B-1787 / 2291 / W) TaxID=272562 RepID=Q97JM7_CLOAB|nr:MULTISPECIES: penicillin-binding protein 2 [Clostridium]AAK79218.1 Penicillin-binding protein 2 [Clostridium acetobutylicum ATCC 824]AEI34522.1 penicillin-binding protein 2 [Clostridium acetobutylicum DSM 1731]AWV81533.1 penicillin-binding protein 2 [Clostridium acetobutylicum]MBC2393172.1 penicillin-binding protein 2 [Clostridium acetobutylicum]MBC2583317.1 penicillin-binding protein 2 [Clostridium acetobutylicum]
MKKSAKFKKIFNRVNVLKVVVLIVFIGITVQLVNLQILQNANYKAKANNTAHRFIKEVAPRGEITDSEGAILATNKQSFDVTYTQTDDNKDDFYDIIAKVFYILDKNGEKQNDSFALKADSNGYRFDFNTDNCDEIKKMQIRFLKDRGFEEPIIKKLYKGKSKESDLTDSEVVRVNNELLKISPKEVFETLTKKYEIPKAYKISIDGQTISKNCDVNDIRRFMVVKDAVLIVNGYSGYKPVAIASNVKQETSFTILQKSNELPGIDISVDPIRDYPYGKLASNVLGYISKITPSSSKQSENYTEKGYDVNSDLIGASGIEAALEDRLRGTSGGRIVEVNKQGKITDELAKKDPYPGQNVKLTINKDVQYAAEQSLINTMASLRAKGYSDSNSGSSYLGNATRGAAVAIDVKTGGVLALASVPNFNPNDFSDPNGLSKEATEKYFSTDIISKAKQVGVPESLYDTLFPVSKSDNRTRIDKYDYLAKPLYNYATLSLIPPGSTFKPLTAIAGLETGVITKDTTIDDEGFFDDGKGYRTPFKADGPQGNNNLIGAIAKSSNAYFMTVGKRLRDAYGSDILAKYAWKFGLGVPPNSNITRTTGIEVQENFGQVYNTYTIKNSFADEGQWSIAEKLQEGKYLKGSSVNLYTEDSDSKKLSTLKASIKENIRTAISTGKTDRNKTEELVTDLISTDPLYKGKTFSKSDVSALASGIVYDEADEYTQATVPGNIYNASIGQGINEFTPLQLANYVATIANGGKRYKVHLVDKVTDSSGKVVYENKPEVVEDTGVSKANIEAVKEGMNAVNDRGTAAGTFSEFPIPAAGKTGTADPYTSDVERSIMRSSYAVYVGFAPRDNPEIAIATVVFDGGFGNGITQIGKSMYEAYFKDVLKQKYNFNFDTDVNAKPETDAITQASNNSN